MNKSSEYYDQVEASNLSPDNLDGSSYYSNELCFNTRDGEVIVIEQEDLLKETGDYDQVHDSNHPTHNLDEDNAVEQDDPSEEVDDYYESLLEEFEDDDEEDYYNHQSQTDSPLFEGDYRCLPLSSCNKTHLDLGNKIIMPEDSLSSIIENQVPMPLQFEIRNLSAGKVSHCGVFEFTGHGDDVVLMPDWMMENMQIEEGDYMYMKNKMLEKATYIKLQPHSNEFLEISNPKAVLEENLQQFSCLTKGDTVRISHGEPVNPTPMESSLNKEQEEEDTEKSKFKPFTGSLLHKQPPPTQSDEEPTKNPKSEPFTCLARKLIEETHSDLGSLPNRHMSDTALDQSDLKKEEEKEATDTPKFKPFMGLARKLDEEAESDPDRSCSPDRRERRLCTMAG
ncbi:hypothetical protein F3Y22_tig00116959pilonHSYRG00583 [Hibiscus syriacus]|uniref:Ubiquitin fusion degradation protein 1-like protein n=1 Tax=Hibiscus syriacus TaxID=106335 RepID=A0A6A2WXQ1_HIBSY|nr:hypothetical protein F3Y22_tig00116959pilonHSYRG00583 [Hibiscus syriacus]